MALKRIKKTMLDQEFVKEINGHGNSIGDLTQLTTTNKTNLISAINENVTQLAQTNSQITNIPKGSSDLILYSFFKSSLDFTTNLYISSNGETIQRINANPINGLPSLRDAAICYFKEYFWFAYTNYNPHDFKVVRTKDFADFETFNISVGLYVDTNSQIWAPEWFIDGDKLYILISVREGSDITDVDGNQVPNFRPYIVECTDVDNVTFGNPVKLTLEDSNKIDPFMTKYNGEYRLVIKDEYDKQIEQWKCSTLKGVYTKVTDAISGLQYTEAPSIIEFNDKFYLYVDDYRLDKGVIRFVTSVDLENWSNVKQLKTKERLRHGTAFVVRDDNAKQKIQNLITTNAISELNVRENFFSLPSLGVNNIVESLEILEGAVYSVSGTTEITINGFNNPSKAKKFYLHIASNSSAKITIVNGSGILEIPNNTIYDASYGDGDTLIPFEYVEAFDKFKPIGINSKKFYDKKVSPIVKNPLGWKRVTLTSQTVSSLDVEDGAVYNVASGNDVVINGIASKPNGTRFGLMLSSGTTGSITVNSGTNISVPGGQFVINVANDRHDRLFEFIKVDQTTFRLKQ